MTRQLRDFRGSLDDSGRRAANCLPANGRATFVLAACLLSAAPTVGCRSTQGRPAPADGRTSGLQAPAVALALPARPADPLRDALLEHERVFLERDSELVAGKFARMARSSFAFFRGTAWMGSPEPSRFKTPASSRLAVLGDPHPENVGTFVDPRGGDRSGGLVLEFNDFDLATFGSYVDDLRRLALGVWIVGDTADLKRKARTAAVIGMVEGYIAEVRGLARGEPPFSLREAAFGGHLEEILVNPDDNEFAKGEPASVEQEALVRALLANYGQTLSLPRVWTRAAAARAKTPAGIPEAMLRIKQVVRRNAGISSFPLLRFQVLVEGPTTDAGDDRLLELKESIGQPAALVLAIQRQYYESADIDPWLGSASSGGKEFRVRGLSPAQRRISADRFAKRLKASPSGKEELKDWAAAFGRLLARGHCRAVDAEHRPGVAAISAALAQGPSAPAGTDAGRGLAEEIADYAERHADTNKANMKAFRELLANRGPLLGWTPEQAGTGDPGVVVPAGGK